jgi:hypothetical protein
LLLFTLKHLAERFYDYLIFITNKFRDALCMRCFATPVVLVSNDRVTESRQSTIMAVSLRESVTPSGTCEHPVSRPDTSLLGLPLH